MLHHLNTGTKLSSAINGLFKLDKPDTTFCPNSRQFPYYWHKLRLENTLNAPVADSTVFSCPKCPDNQCVFIRLAYYIVLLRRLSNYNLATMQNNYVGWDYDLSERSRLLEHSAQVPQLMDQLITDHFWAIYNNVNSRVILSIIDSYNEIEGKEDLGTIASSFLIGLKMNKVKDLEDYGILFICPQFADANNANKDLPIKIPATYKAKLNLEQYSSYSLDSIYNMLYKVRHVVSRDYGLWFLLYRYYQHIVSTNNVGYIVDVNNTRYVKYHGDVINMCNIILNPSPLSPLSLIESMFANSRLAKPRDGHPILNIMISMNSFQHSHKPLPNSLNSSELKHVFELGNPKCLVISYDSFKSLPLPATFTFNYNPFGKNRSDKPLREGYKSIADFKQEYILPKQAFDVAIINNPYDFIDDYDKLFKMILFYGCKRVLIRLHNCNNNILTWWVSKLGKYFNKWLIDKNSDLNTLVCDVS
ncbi:MAG: hypothetical protein ACYSYU_00080 [Planctomycetota bacterium]|jgi:hypothetical protein